MFFRCLAAACLLSLNASAFAREWTDISGRYHADAELVSYRVKEVVLKKTNGATIVVPMAQLSVADRKYVGAFAQSTPKFNDSEFNDSDSSPTQLPLLKAESAPATTSAAASVTPSVTPPANDSATASVTTSLASYRPAATPVSLAQGSAEGDPPPYKRIFSGCYSTFHLVGDQGTAAFWLRRHNGHCHHYLTMLTINKDTPAPPISGYKVYEAVDPVGGIQAWAFQDVETPWCQRNAVYYRPVGGTHWHFYGFDYREVLWP